MSVPHLNDENFEETISKGVTLVDFYATWCGPCRMIAPIIEQLHQEMKDKARVVKVDIDQSPRVAESMAIKSVPTLMVFKDGQAVKTVVGVKDFDYLLELINSQL